MSMVLFSNAPSNPIAVSIIPKDEEMLCRNIEELKEENLCEFLIQLDIEETEVQKLEENIKKINLRRSEESSKASTESKIMSTLACGVFIYSFKEEFQAKKLWPISITISLVANYYIGKFFVESANLSITA